MAFTRSRVRSPSGPPPLPLPPSYLQLIKETLDRLGLRADNPSAHATSRLGEHDIPWAMHQHQALSKGIGALKAAIDAMADKPGGQAELAGLQASLRETQDKLAERINADITLQAAQ